MPNSKFQILNSFLLLFISLALVLVGTLSQVDAAEFKITTPKPTINSQQKVKIEVIMGSKGEAINALEGKVFWPKEYFDLVAINDGNSIVNFWLTKPSVDVEGYLSFAGIIPGGYAESGGLLFGATLQTKKDGETEVSLKEVKALINDGEGTPAPITIVPLKLSIASSTPLLLDFPNPDHEKPEPFKPEISTSTELFDGRYFMVFSTQDKGSGVNYYEVIESSKILEIRKINASLWKRVESPYLLKDQTLSSYVYVKAVDVAGNERVIEVLPIKARAKFWPDLSQLIFYGIIIAIIILGGIAINSIRLRIVIRKKDHVHKEGKKIH